jgi:hypothetical protein
MRRVPWWVWASATPFGLGAWTPIIPGRELQRPSWVAWGALWSVVTIAGWVAAIVSDGSDAGGLMIILGWCGAIATTLVIRPSYLEQASSAFTRGLEAAELRLRERREAQELAAAEPELALELGIGRPDRPGAQHAGLVDVNNAPISALLRLPGIDDALAHRIVELREELDGFESVHDLGSVLDLDGNAVERLRDHAVFLPR